MAGSKLAILGAGLLIAVGLAFLVEGAFHTEQTASAALSGASTQKRWIAVAPGRVEPLSREIKVSAPVMGRITEVLVKPNDKVFAGELLVRLDDTEALARLAAAQSQADLSKLDRNEAAARKGSAERRKAEDGVADAERVVADARDALDRAAAARRAGRTSQASFDSAPSRYRSHRTGWASSRIRCAGSRRRPGPCCRAGRKASSTSPVRT